jgi:hypothetical protein
VGRRINARLLTCPWAPDPSGGDASLMAGPPGLGSLRGAVAGGVTSWCDIKCPNAKGPVRHHRQRTGH